MPARVMRCAKWSAIAWLWACPAGAAGVILRQASPEAATTELTTRLRGELQAMALTVRVETTADERFSSSEELPPDADAVMRLGATEQTLVAEIWLRDEGGAPVRWTTLVENAESRAAPEKLALRAAEALHSRFFEAELTPPATDSRSSEVNVSPASLPGPPVRDQAANSESPDPAGTRPSLALGAVIFTGTRGLGPAVAPLLRFDWPLGFGITPQVSISGLGTESRAATPNGGATLDWNYAIVGMGYHPFRIANLEPSLNVATGAVYSTVRGQAESPLAAHTSRHWLWVTELSLGVRFDFADNHYLSVAGHGQFTRPGLSVHVADEVVAVVGSPNWLASVMAGVKL